MATQKITGEKKDNFVSVRLNDQSFRKLKKISEDTGYNQTQAIEFCINLTGVMVRDTKESEFDNDLAVKMIRFLYGEDTKKAIKNDLPKENRSSI